MKIVFNIVSKKSVVCVRKSSNEYRKLKLKKTFFIDP